MEQVVYRPFCIWDQESGEKQFRQTCVFVCCQCNMLLRISNIGVMQFESALKCRRGINRALHDKDRARLVNFVSIFLPRTRALSAYIFLILSNPSIHLELKFLQLSIPSWHILMQRYDALNEMIF